MIYFMGKDIGSRLDREHMLSLFEWYVMGRLGYKDRLDLLLKVEAKVRLEEGISDKDLFVFIHRLLNRRGLGQGWVEYFFKGL